MKQKVKNHKYMTKTGLLILSVIAVILYFRVINIIYSNIVNNDVIHQTTSILLLYPPTIIIFYLIMPIHIFSIVYKKFRKDTLGY